MTVELDSRIRSFQKLDGEKWRFDWF
jgi:hypothetical protein